MSQERIDHLKASSKLTGLDFVHVLAVQTELWVYFHRDPAGLDDPFSMTPLSNDQLTIVSTSGGESMPEVEVLSAVQAVDSLGVTFLRITTATPGDNSLYRLTINDYRIDLFFKSLEFSFKAACPTKLIDCLPEPKICAPEDDELVEVDTTARDFNSLREALLDFARLRHPEWRESIEADASVMFMEVLAALGDELSYIQDRYSREAYLRTASQRRSLSRLVRLVDYEIHDGRSGTTWLEITVDANTHATAGTRVWAASDLGTQVGFEIGQGLAQALADPVVTYDLRLAWNTLSAYTFTGAIESYAAGTTSLYLHNINGVLPVEWIGKTILLRTNPGDLSEPERRHLVVITAAADDIDTLEGDKPLLRIEWDPEHALPTCFDAATLTAHGNMVPATAGERVSEYFSIRGDANDPTNPRAVERQGPKDSNAETRAVLFRHSLGASESSGLGFLGDDLRSAKPEIRVARIINPNPESVDAWQYRRTLLSSLHYEEHYTLEHGTWRRVAGYQRAPIFGDFAHTEYASSAGHTILFGDGEFGVIPSDGLLFRVDYRTGPGAAGNVAADVIRNFDANEWVNVTAINNPLSVTDGVDPEQAETIRQLAPAAFRERTYRAVRTKDYCATAEELPWVERAGARSRWTGSWHSIFVTPDPEGTFTVSQAHRKQLEDLLDCRRLAGREVHVLDPRYRPVHVEITVCVEAGHIPSEVRDRVLRRIRGDGETPGLYDADSLTFGTPIYRLTLEAALRELQGVRAVKRVQIAARGVHSIREMEMVYRVPDNQILRLASDPRFPERGSVKVFTEGG